MVQYGTVADAEVRLDSTEPYVVCTEHEAFHAGVHESSGTHRTRFDRRVDRRARQAVIPDPGASRAEGNDLSVSSRIVIRYRSVRRSGEKIAVRIDDNRTDRNFASLFSFQRHLERTPHPTVIRIRLEHRLKFIQIHGKLEDKRLTSLGQPRKLAREQARVSKGVTLSINGTAEPATPRPAFPRSLHATRQNVKQ
jgi:hypothetical protein